MYLYARRVFVIGDSVYVQSIRTENRRGLGFEEKEVRAGKSPRRRRRTVPSPQRQGGRYCNRLTLPA